MQKGGLLRPAEIVINGLEFDSRNLGHLKRHGVDKGIVNEVVGFGAKFFLNLPDRSGSHMIIGPDRADRFWTILIVLVDEASGVWRPITGWPSTNKEIRAWRGEY